MAGVRAPWDVVVIGGGPAGSATAAFLAMRSRRVLLLEAARFPRYHIGESLIPGAVRVLQELGVWDRIDRHGFLVKRGNAFVWGEDPTLWTVAFADAGIDVYAYQVQRSEFDALLLGHARDAGVVVREDCRVEDVMLDREGRCTGVVFATEQGERRAIQAAWTVDASGQSSFLGRRMGLVRRDPVLNNLAIWSYWNGSARLPAPASTYTLSAAIDEGWIWHIPLADGSTSVGVVVGVDALRAGRGRDLSAFYGDRIARSEVVSGLLAGAARCDRLRTTRDWSYRCERLSGPGWLIVGDAAGFVDPVLSTGMGMALQAAFAASEAIDLALGGLEPELVLREYETFYQRYIGQFFDFVHYFYDANRHVDSYFWQARRLVDPGQNDTARRAFIYLISGLNDAATERTLTRTIETAAFERLGTSLGVELLAARRRAMQEEGNRRIPIGTAPVQDPIGGLS